MNLRDLEGGHGCICNARFPGHVFHKIDCHAVPFPPVLYVVRIVGVAKHHWEIKSFDSAFLLAQTLRRAYPDRWVEVKLDGTLCALLEPKAVAVEDDQLELA